MESIFTRPVFINPQAYLVIPELQLLSHCVPYKFVSNEYVFQVITDGAIECKLLQANDQYILHLDLYSSLGNSVLGEFYLKSDTINPDKFSTKQQKGLVTIKFNDSEESESKLIDQNYGQNDKSI